MRRLLTIARNDLRIFFSSWGNIIGLTVMPIAFTLVLGWAFSSDSGPDFVRVDVIDLDGSAPSAAFVEQIRAVNDTLLLCPEDDTVDGACGLDGDTLTVEVAQTRLQENRTAALIIIPAGYRDALATFAPVEVDFYSKADPTAPSPLLQSLDAVIQRVNTAMVASEVGMDIVSRLEVSAPSP
ncbi:MAG: ABC transporter permease, partial [Caldilineaceae bacterium]|nr:ABC transporter permease [Caldilineaceae bacterium]